MTLDEELSRLRGTLPRGSVFECQMIDGRTVHLRRLAIPGGKRGVGTIFLARVFSACDEYGVCARLEADPTDLPGDPSTLDLVRWYMRFGCVILSADDDSVAMAREPRVPPLGLQEILQEYEEAKADDLTVSEFDALRPSSPQLRG